MRYKKRTTGKKMQVKGNEKKKENKCKTVSEVKHYPGKFVDAVEQAARILSACRRWTSS